MTAKAKVVYYDSINDVEQIEVGDHVLQYGGVGDGYCYHHQTFDCIDNLTEEEKAAITTATS